MPKSSMRGGHADDLEKVAALGALEPELPKRNLGRRSLLARLAQIALSLALAFVFVTRFRTHLSTPTRLPYAEVISVHSGTRNPAFLVKARHGAVSTENQNCSTIGVDILQAGGNAVDAAVASTLCVGTVSMFSSGIGGGGFATSEFISIALPHTLTDCNTVRLPNGGGVYTVDFRETAPTASNKSMFGSDPMTSIFGGLSVGVPGEIRGLQEMHDRWGRLPWEQVVLPAAKLAEGWFVGPELAKRLQTYKVPLEANADWRPIFAPNGKVLLEGEWISRHNLSRTLHEIARQGPDAFYTGRIARSLVKKISSTGGILTLEDLAGYKVHVDKAFEGTYRGKKVFTTHPPTSGIVLLHMLNLLEGYDIPEDGLTPLNFHRMVEAMKFAAAARTRLGDPAFNLDDDIEEIPTKKFARRLSKNITDDTTHTVNYYNPVYDVKEDHGTMHLSVVDSDHMAVAITSTVNLIFGSFVLDPETGVILNDEMDDFSRPGIPNYFGLYPSPFNYPEPNKRPLSSTCPTIIENEDGSLHLVIGGSGGSRIFPAVAQVIVGLDVGKSISAAIEAPRAHSQLLPPTVDLDSTVGDDIVQGLLNRGHNATVVDVNTVKGVVQGIVVQDGFIWAAADSRKNGIAAGY
ncbi:gamma-glutamyltranspeptidase [Auriculariales sp. MPI-PUGE-AT-0066]|nr:gamma-glutamyltranspeptidase [Auriculariales sp. MPI-PUGE-AT-0066]